MVIEKVRFMACIGWVSLFMSVSMSAHAAGTMAPTPAMVAPPLGMVAAPPNAPSSAIAGKPVMPLGEGMYQTCATCHGTTGAGDGPKAATLNPKPVTFKGMTMDRIQKAIVIGVPSKTPGHAIANLYSPEEIRALSEHVDRLTH